MSRTVSFAKPWLGEAESEALAEVVASGWVMQGKKVEGFERVFAETVGASHACAVTSCTSALHLVLVAAGVGPGDVVITTSHSFIATANSVRLCGAEPVFVDLEAEGLNLCPDALARCLERDFEAGVDGLRYRDLGRLRFDQSALRTVERSKAGRLGAILVVHQAGTPADLARILPIAEGAGVPLIEDAACALGSDVSLDGGATFEPVARPRGVAACFSFHPRKVITTGEGGMISTRSEAVDRDVRLRREHAMSISTRDRDAKDAFVPETYLMTGFNYRMTDLQAAMGLVQMERLPEIVKRRRALGDLYATLLAEVPGVRTPVEPPYARVNHQSYVVRLDDPEIRPAVMAALKDKGIATRLGITNIHEEPPYAAGGFGPDLPNTVRARAEGLILPLHPLLSEDDVAYVADALAEALT